jgi:transglutaminase-like putative cysteine protease
MGSLRRVAFTLLCLAALFTGQPAAAQPAVHGIIERTTDHYAVAADLTYVQTSELDLRLLTQRGLRAGERASSSFYADKQKLEVMEAWVDQPDGSRIQVPPSGIFTRPSAASQNAPGFNGSQTTTVLFPQLREGSRTHVKWRRTQLSPPLLGFNTWSQPPLEWAVLRDETTIVAPASVQLHWRGRGEIAVSDTVTAGVRTIRAVLGPQAAQEVERSSVAASDFQPVFLATSLPNLEALGGIYHRQSQDQAAVTPAIAARAARIVGAQTGLPAARAIYNWVTTNIRYVAIYMNPNDGWVPHAAEQVLTAGYGDCKDHVVLMQALLAARGIAAEAGIIDWGTRTADMPLWVPGQFNHAIIYLPGFDHYANPTDPFASFDALDRRLAGKTVVLATEHGRVSRTPVARPASYRYAISSTVTLSADGSIVGTATISTSPSLDGRLRATVAGASSMTDLAERLLSATPEGGYGVLTSSDPRALDQPFETMVTWTSPHGISFQGGDAYPRIPAGPDIEPASRLRAKLSPTGTRRHPLLADVGDYVWDTRIVPQPGLEITRLPADIDAANSIGRYAATYRREGPDLLVHRNLVIERDVVPAAEYQALETLLMTAIDDARTVLVVSRRDGS